MSESKNNYSSHGNAIVPPSGYQRYDYRQYQIRYSEQYRHKAGNPDSVVSDIDRE